MEWGSAHLKCGLLLLPFGTATARTIGFLCDAKKEHLAYCLYMSHSSCLEKSKRKDDQQSGVFLMTMMMMVVDVTYC